MCCAPMPCPFSGLHLWGWGKPDPNLSRAHPCMVRAHWRRKPAGLGKGSGAYSPRYLSQPQALYCESTRPTQQESDRAGVMSEHVRTTCVLRQVASCPQWTVTSS